MFGPIQAGMSNLLDFQILSPQRRDLPPAIQFEVPLPSFRVGNLNTALIMLRKQAWASFFQLADRAGVLGEV